MQNENLRKISTHIDYYCFSTETGDTTLFQKSKKPKKEGKNLRQYSEVLRQLNQHEDWRQKEIEQARAKGKLILFDLRNNSFINEKGEIVDISEKIIFPRSTIEQADFLIENIEKAGGKSIAAREDKNIIENWFKIIKTERKYKLTTIKEIESNLGFYEKEFGKSFFLKTVEKHFSGICIILESSNIPNENNKETKKLLDIHYESINGFIKSPETLVLVCKKVNIIKDEFGKREWRAFVVNDELICLSRTSDDVVRIEEYVYEIVEKKIKQFKGRIPSSYVVDFFEYKEDDYRIFDVVEFNPIVASGTFENNNIVF